LIYQIFLAQHPNKLIFRLPKMLKIVILAESKANKLQQNIWEKSNA
jgi:hypothetical protein